MLFLLTPGKQPAHSILRLGEIKEKGKKLPELWNPSTLAGHLEGGLLVGET